MSVGEIAGLVAAVAFVVLVGLLALPLLRLTSTLDAARRSIERLTDETVPTLRGTATTVDNVNATLVKADGITANVQDVSSNVSALTGLATSLVGGPAIKVSAFSYGVRRALAHRRELDARVRSRGSHRRTTRAGSRRLVGGGEAG